MEIGTIIILCFGLVFILIGLIMMLLFQRGNRSGQDIEATVIATRNTRQGRAGNSQTARYFATLRYQLNGQTYTTEISTDTISQPKKNQTLVVGIDPAHPEKVHLRRGKVYLVFYVLGASVIAFAILLSVMSS